MLCSMRVLLSAVSPGRPLLVRSCPITMSPRRPLHCSLCHLRKDAPDEVTLPEDELDKAFTLQQRDTILRTLNMASHNQGFQPASIQSTCKSILISTNRTNRQGTANFIKPGAPLQWLQAAESVVSIVFGLKKMAWVHMERSMMVKDWQQHECFHFVKGKHLPEIYLEEISSVVSKLPQADLYILEKPAVSNQNASLFPVVLHLRTVEAMLYCLLNSRFLADGQHRVFSIARNTVGKHFEIMVGESRTSGVDAVQRLIDEAVIASKPRVTFMPELIQRYRHHFKARGQDRKEEMCDALVQAVTFYELALSK